MKDPYEIIQKLSDKSVKENLTLEEWRDYLLDLRLEVENSISIVEKDIENLKK